MYSLGYKESSAVPVRWETVEAILVDVDDQLTGRGREQLSKVKIALLCRDAAVLLYLWITLMRGHEAGQLRVKNITLHQHDCAPAWPEIGQWTLIEGQAVIISPDSTKVNPHPSSTFTPIWRRDEAVKGHCLMWRLHMYAKAMEDCGQPIDDYVFLPLRADNRCVFQRVGMKANAMNAMLGQHMKRLGLWQGESLHGIKRGKLQHAVFVGKESIADASRGVHKNQATTGKYVHPVRHSARLKQGRGEHSRD